VKSGSVTAILAGAGIPLTKSTVGTVTLSANNTYTGGTTVTGGTLLINGPGALGTGGLTVTGGTAALSTGLTKYLRLPALTVSGSGLVDVANKGLIVNYTGSSPAGDIRAMLKSAYGPGNWSGTTGITSSAAQASPTPKPLISASRLSAGRRSLATRSS